MVLEIPAGTRDRDGETEEQTARRELAEEAGLEAAHLEPLIGTWNTPGVSDQHTTIFLATGLSPCRSRPDGVEEGYLTVETVRLADLDDLVADGTLKDESTVLGLYLARQRLAATGRRAVSTVLPRAAEEFLSWLEVERGRSPRTLAAYRQDLAAYQADVEARNGGGIEAATVRRRGGAPGRAAPDAHRGLGGPGPLEHPGLVTASWWRRDGAPTTPPWTCRPSRSPTCCRRR